MNESKQSINISYTKRDEVFENFYRELENINVKYSEIGLNLEEDGWGHSLFFRYDNIEGKINDKKLLKKVIKLIDEYEHLLNVTCDCCGNKIEDDAYRTDLCNKCFFLLQIKSNYKDIDRKGFSYEDYFDGKEKTRRKILWNDIEKVEFIKDIPSEYSHLKGPVFKIVLTYKKNKCVKYLSGEIEVVTSDISLYATTENFYTLLKNISDKLLNTEDKRIKDIFINNLKDCGICGYKGIFENNKYCIVCDSHYCIELTDRLKKMVSSVEEINKNIQLDYYVKLKNEYRYPRLEKEFNKSENYTRMTTEKEVKEYIKQFEVGVETEK